MINDTYLLDEVVDLYLAQRQIDKKKYYDSHLINAKLAWRMLFKNTIFAVNSEWAELKAGYPFNYVDIPKGTVRFFSAALVDDCGEIVPLYYNNKLNILPKPTQKKCGCKNCDCGGTCEDVNSLVYTTKLLFTINNVDYYEKIWLKFCDNGDILEYREVPTKKYNDYTGDGADFNDDYNDDYQIAPAFTDYTIVTETFNRKLCNIEVKPCGCPIDSHENEETIIKNCSQFLPIFGKLHKRHCERFLPNTNDNGYGEVKMSECGTKLYFVPSKRHHYEHKKLPTHILINYQTSGENCSTAVQVPEYALEPMFYGLDFYSKRFNNVFSLSERKSAEYSWKDAQNQLILFLNPFNLEVLSNVQDEKIYY